MDKKVCSKCGVEKDIKEFYFRKDTGKYRNYCKACRKVVNPKTENDILFEQNKRRCKKCLEIKDLSEYYFRKENNKYRLECKSCLLAHQSENKKIKENNQTPIKGKEIIQEPKTYICKCCNAEKNIDEFRISSNKNKNGITRHFRTCYECEKKQNRERHLKKQLKNPDYKLKFDIEQENIELLKLNKKKCLVCLEIKDLSDFYYRRDIKNYRQWCKECEKARTKNFYTDNKEEILDKQHKYYSENRELMLRRKKEYADTHKEQLRDYHTRYTFNRRKNDDIFHFKSQIRHLINMSFRRRGIQKKGKTEDIVGCDFETFNNYLLRTFKDNYGYDYDGTEEVHVDHIIPLATAKTEEEIIKLCHYTNLQLLKAKDNLEKNDKLDWRLKEEK